MANAIIALQGVCTGSRTAMPTLKKEVSAIKAMLYSAKHDTSTAKFLLGRIERMVDEAGCQVAFPDEDLLGQLDRLLERVREALNPLFFPEQPPQRRQIPKGLLQDNAVLIGDWALLENAVSLLEGDVAGGEPDYERYRAVRVLCDWWNTNAPESSQRAGCFFINELNHSGEGLLMLGNRDCPASHIEDYARAKGYALFEKPGFPTIAICFLRGRAHNTRTDCGSTLIHTADGEVYWEVGAPPEKINEAYYAISGLQELATCLST